MPVQQFYDALSPYYDLIFEDWDASMARQGTAIADLLARELGSDGAPGSARILDAACGIGTQALPLAARGYRVTGRDISPTAIGRLRQEAAARQLQIEAGVADMRALASSVVGPFDAVLAFDNAVPHLLTDGDILTAFRQFHEVLRPGGLSACSVRDYDQLERGVSASLSYGERTRGAERFLVRQEWAWTGPMHYDMTFVVDQIGPDGTTNVLRTTARYHAVSVGRLLELMDEAGLVECRRIDDLIYQPVLVGRRPVAG